jgi:hypothetical protein
MSLNTREILLARLKATILALIERGFTPYLFLKETTPRLKYLLELPPGKIIRRLIDRYIKPTKADTLYCRWYFAFVTDRYRSTS